jgi:aerobic-type carbon monoxide dehydrogenase small subunit (CoxS/CutS family)
MPLFSITVNGRAHEVDAESDMPLLWVLRDRLQLFGTKYGCGIGACGACTVHDGRRAIRSCTTTISAAAGRSFTTIEGLSANGSHPCQRAWIEEDVAQCGFCQPGMIMEAASLLVDKPRPTDGDIDAAFSGHVCRCGTYTRIRRAVHRAATEMRR